MKKSDKKGGLVFRGFKSPKLTVHKGGKARKGGKIIRIFFRDDGPPPAA